MRELQYYGSKISENISKRDPEGYLYCLNVPISRTGVQEYLASEIGMEGNGVVKVYRTPEEVFSPRAMASFEGMPVTADHPSEAVSSQNIAAYSKGHVQNVRRGQGQYKDCVMADFVITHSDLIDAVLNGGLREVSCGYECDYRTGEDGKVYQCDICGNHVAVVDRGRAGDRVAIRDAANNGIFSKTKKERSQIKMDKKPIGSVIGRMFASFARDQAVEPDEVAAVADELMAAKISNDEKEETMQKNQCDGTPVPVAPVEEKKTVTDESEIELAQTLAKLIGEVKGLKDQIEKIAEEKASAPVADEETPAVQEEKPKDALDELEEEAKATDEEATEEPLIEHGTPMNVEAVTVPADEVEDSEEEPNDEVKEAVVSAIQELKPIVAGLPAKDRKVASDALSKALRKIAGMPKVVSKDSKASLARVAARRAKVADSAESDERQLGASIMAKYNPHYRNRK